MNNRYKLWATCCIRFGLICFLSVFDFRQTVSSQGSDSVDRAVCGEVSPLVPMQSAEAVHMGLVWKSNSQHPKILLHGRFPEYTPNDVADPSLTDLAIARGSLITPGLQFNSSLRDVLHGFFPVFTCCLWWTRTVYPARGGVSTWLRRINVSGS